MARNALGRFTSGNRPWNYGVSTKIKIVTAKSSKTYKKGDPITTPSSWLLQPQIQSLNSYLGVTFQQLASKVVDVMGEVIEQNRQRPSIKSGRSRLVTALRKTIKIEREGDNIYTINIGDYKYLDRVVPYWWVRNYGGSPWYKKGKFISYGLFQDGLPKAGGFGTAWLEGATAAGPRGGLIQGAIGGGKNRGRMKPIQGIYYIEAGVKWLRDGVARAVPEIARLLKSKKFTEEKLLPFGPKTFEDRSTFEAAMDVFGKRQFKTFDRRIGAVKVRREKKVKESKKYTDYY